ncbi:uncharacterized protein LAESUDRAFT_655027 [Laetiporus sulphureus 93-53]|uniref:Uncharacterized protein n=1 Tax=Laetiporus sulphureus 93-53 TaxID=1314785 RepID=A0A165DWY8_9APHY|nr:uncharacterized protein LAESUDRAFT_655027 [Laetiporus sulphureus 93-53]KZT05797.1 hypothetical protein LAESUDRAFT_655027 [Laetiporus sulphureus 93-53]
MVLSHEDSDHAHSYWYAQIIGIFHAHVSALKRMSFLWVRWYSIDLQHNWGWKHKWLPHVGFLDADKPGAFRFLDPDQVMRAVHLIPGFAHGITDMLLPPSFVCAPAEQDADWQYYYTFRFVDCDMYMRFRSKGVGHQSI